MIQASRRLSGVRRVFDPYEDRRSFVRLDRNEDPVGWDAAHFREFLAGLTPHDLAAYSDSTDFVGALSRWAGHSADEIYVVSGSDQAIKAIFETYVDPGDRVLLQRPAWRMYDVYSAAYGAVCEFVDYDRELNIDWDRVLSIVAAGGLRMLILATPNQPTGTIVPRPILLELIRTAAARDCLVVVDEAYYLFCEETVAGEIDEFPNLIVARTFSKAFGLASLRLGYCIAQPGRIRELMLLRPVTDANGIALTAGLYVLGNLDWTMARIADTRAGRQYLFEQLKTEGLATFPSEANFLLVRYNTMEHAQRILGECRRRGYLLKGPFGFPPLENCIRITTGPLDLMRRFWAECGGQLAAG